MLLIGGRNYSNGLSELHEKVTHVSMAAFFDAPVLAKKHDVICVMSSPTLAVSRHGKDARGSNICRLDSKIFHGKKVILFSSAAVYGLSRVNRPFSILDKLNGN